MRWIFIILVSTIYSQQQQRLLFEKVCPRKSIKPTKTKVKGKGEPRSKSTSTTFIEIIEFKTSDTAKLSIFKESPIIAMDSKPPKDPPAKTTSLEEGNTKSLASETKIIASSENSSLKASIVATSQVTHQGTADSVSDQTKTVRISTLIDNPPASSTSTTDASTRSIDIAASQTLQPIEVATKAPKTEEQSVPLNIIEMKSHPLAESTEKVEMQRNESSKKANTTSNSSINSTSTAIPIPTNDTIVKLKTTTSPIQIAVVNGTNTTQIKPRTDKNLTQSGELSPVKKVPINETETIAKREKAKFNYASFDCGAVVTASNEEAKHVTSILSNAKDAYMLNPCSAKKFVEIELCQDILITSIRLANFEYFSSMLKNFEVFGSSKYPPTWISLGAFTGKLFLS